ncbi:MAG: AAA family ATPase [Candidatus Woesearchaeota archaeon]
MKIILLNGSSCSGKSTIVKNIMKEKDNYFQLSYDSLKWLFSRYNPEKKYGDVQKMLISIAKTVFKMKYNVICDSCLIKIYRQKLITIAKKYNYKIIEINLEADYDVLSKRFDERVKSALADPKSRICNVSKTRFKELNEMFHKEKNSKALTFRTDLQTVDEVSEKILKLL